MFYITISLAWMVCCHVQPCKTYYSNVKQCMTVTNQALTNQIFNTFSKPASIYHMDDHYHRLHSFMSSVCVFNSFWAVETIIFGKWFPTLSAKLSHMLVSSLAFLFLHCILKSRMLFRLWNLFTVQSTKYR